MRIYQLWLKKDRTIRIKPKWVIITYHQLLIKQEEEIHLMLFKRLLFKYEFNIYVIILDALIREWWSEWLTDKF